MAKHLDYISPMIYPSHYADGNYGIDHPDIHPYETITAALQDSKKDVYKRQLLESVTFQSGKCIFSVVRRKDMDFYGVESSDLDGIVDQLRITEGVEVAIFLHETENHVYKVSMRSNNIVDVSKVAAYFGGGGYIRAAGCTMSGSVHDVINNLSGHIEKQMKEYEA